MTGSRTLPFALSLCLLPVTASALAASSASAAPVPGLIPGYARPNGAVTERQLAELTVRIGQQLGTQSARPIAVTHPFAPVTRLRVLAALVKLGIVGDGALSPAASPQRMPPDAIALPAWGAPYVAAAVEQGWWPADRPINGSEPATWAFVKTIVERMVEGAGVEVTTAGQVSPPSAAGALAAAVPGDGAGSYTGLVLDARGLDAQRAMGPRILDEDGAVLYPDPGHVPGKSFLEDHGMAAYATDGAAATRSGSHPLLLLATGVSGPAHEDLIVSRETARQIREADGRGGFFSRWAVTILIGPR